MNQFQPNNPVYNPYTPMTNNNVANQSNIISVITITGGEDSALNFVMEPNKTMFFISSDTSEMFMRGVGANGMTETFKAFDIKEKMPNYQANLIGQTGDFATKEDFNNLSKEIQDLKNFLDELTSPDVKG